MGNSLAEAAERQRIHREDAPDMLDCIAGPKALGLRVEPSRALKMIGEHHEPADPLDPAIVAEVERSTRGVELIRRHQGVTDHDELIMPAAFMEEIADADGLIKALRLVDMPVDAVMEIIGAQLAEMARALCRGEKP